MTNLLDKFGRKIDYLRISLTDRCNLRCQYCMPADGIKFKSHNEIIRYEEIIRIVKVGVQFGIRKVRISGGEPLVRQGVVDLVRKLAHIEKLNDISMTTNAVLLSEYAAGLKEAGLGRVNISLDSLKKEKFKMITRRDHFEEVIAGINSALEVGLAPVKINVVVMKGVNDDEILDFVSLSQNYPLHVRFIEFMPLGRSEQIQDERYLSLERIKEEIKEEADIQPAVVKSNGPAENYKLPGSKGTIGFITPISHNFCAECNRIRLTADGRLRPCLASNIEVDMHDDCGEIKDINDIKEKFSKAVSLKPGQHHFNQETEEISQRDMFQIGG